MPKIKPYFLLAIFMLSLSSCAVTHRLGEGVVMEVTPLHEHDYRPHDRTYTAAKVGGSIGAVGGGIIGGAVGLLPGFMSGSAPGLLICTLGGSAIGATFFGLTGSAMGGTVGYASDLVAQNRPQYEFKVKSNNEPQMITVTQYSSAIPLNTPVRILEENGTIFIRKLK